MKKNLKLLIFACFIFLFTDKVYANSINSIKMDIYLDKNGDAHITEVWDANLTKGTEGYRSYKNIGNSTIINYSVKNEEKEFSPYSSNNYWDIDASFSEKAYHYGIVNNELCFGISSYGRHTYTLNYTITGFVSNLNDSQMVYWQLIPNELAKLTNNIYIKIYADEKFSNSLDIWGYGNYGGYAYVYDGYIEVSNEKLKNDEYVTVLIKFPSNTFNTINNIDKDFNYYFNISEENIERYKENKFYEFIGKVIGLIIPIFYFVIFLLIVNSSINASNKSGDKLLDFGTNGKKLPKDVPMFRDLPCEKNIFYAYWIAHNYKLMKKQTDFLGTILLKWLKENKIRIENSEVGTIFKKENTTIVFSDPNMIMETDIETELYEYMYKASKDGILESKEFERWCNSNYNKILKWFDKVLNYQNEKLITAGLLTPNETVKFKIFKYKSYKLSDKLYDEAVKMDGLKKFFNEFDNMSDKEALEVNLWKEYLMYAQIFGVADKVAKQFKKLYPDVITDYSYESVVFIRTISYSGMNKAISARDRARSYSSGGGGFSSGGGGGGSFGSSGGGGFR